MDFATMGLAANLGIATATPLTDLRHCKIATLGVSSDRRHFWWSLHIQRKIFHSGFSDHLAVK